MDTRDNKVPQTARHIEDEFCKYCGHTAGYLVRVAQVHRLTYGKLKELAEMKKKYQTNFPRMLALIKRSYSPSQIREFLQVRDELGSEDDTPSLERIVKFSQHFSDIEPDADSIGECIINIKEMLIGANMLRLRKTKSADDYVEHSVFRLNDVINNSIRISQRLQDKTYHELVAYLDSQISDENPFATMAISVFD